MKLSHGVFASVILSSSVLTLQSVAGSGQLEKAILSFPEIGGWNYRPDVAVGSANTLITAGKDAACAELERLARAEPGNDDSDKLSEYDAINRKICHLCRLLFVPKSPTEPLRRPRLGTLSGLPLDSANPLEWPDLPFVIIDGIPLSGTLGYAGSGVSERAVNYLAYCKSNGVFRTKPFPQPTSLATSNAVAKLFESPSWKQLPKNYQVDQRKLQAEENYAKDMIWKEAANVSKPSAK